MSKSYKDLKVWQQSFSFVKDVYDLCQRLPKSEQFGLVSQLQRCAISIPSNLAEGQQRSGIKEFKQFISIARGSAAELATQLLLVNNIYKIDTSKQVAKLEEIQKMLYALQKNL